MPRRMNLPGASELFRPANANDEVTAEGTSEQSAPQTPAPATAPEPIPVRAPATGRVRHDEKITVYVSRDELLALEHGRLALRSDFSLAVDRGRLVRESVAIVMEDLVANGENSELVRRLRGR